MPKSQPQKTMLKRRQSAVGILFSGLEWIAAELYSYGTLPDEPLKPCLLQMPNIFPTLPLHLPLHCVSNSNAPSASQVHIDCSSILKIIFMPVILGKQIQGRGPQGSTSCSKMFATLSQPIFCTGEIFRLRAMLFYLTPHFIAHITRRCGDGIFNLIATHKSNFGGALQTY